MPEWLWTSLIGVIFVISGCFGKLLVDKRKDKLFARSEKLSKIVRLRSLLRASKAVFFNHEKKTLHSLIRSYSDNSLRQINGALSTLLKQDNDFKTMQVNFKKQNDLVEETIRDLNNKNA